MAEGTNIAKTFIKGRMNKVVDERLLPEGEYVDAMNLRLGSTEISEIGSVENTKGNFQLTTLTYVDTNNTPISATARCIGAYEDSATNTIYWFVHDGAFVEGGTTKILDLIVSFNTETQTLIYHVISVSPNLATPTTLNFNERHLITGVNLVNDMLFFTDDINPPRKINVTKSYAYPDTTTNTDLITAEELLVIKRPPAESPIITEVATGGQENFMEGRFLCFAYRYLYEDGEYSATSQFTSPAFVPDQFQFSPESFLNDGMLNITNSVNIVVDTGGPLVVGLDLLFKEADNSIIKVIEKVNKVEAGWLDNTTQTWYFDNSKIFTILPESEILRLYDNVPKLAKAQTIMGNRLVYGNYTEGYDLIDRLGDKVRLTYEAELVSLDIETIDLTTSTSAYTYVVDGGTSITVNNALITINTAGLELKTGARIGIGVSLTHDAFSGTAGLAGFPTSFGVISVETIFTLPNDYADGFALATSVEFAAAISATANSFPIPANPCTAAQTSTLTDRFTCATPPEYTGITPGGAFIPPNQLTRYSAGVVFEQEGVTILASAATPDQFQLVFPAIKYIDTNAVPAIPYVPLNAYQFEYYNVQDAAATFDPLGIPSSLHSNRGYEVGIVYMDEFNRSTSALVSDLNTVHIPCSASDTQNKIKITIPTSQRAPGWAHRYKFVLKPDVLGYNTIYGNIVYTALNTNFTYILLEGENTRKVTEGDELILKRDVDGPINECVDVTALEVKAQPRNFLSLAAGDPNTVSGLTPEPGVYMKINSNNFNAVPPPNATVLPPVCSATEYDGGDPVFLRCSAWSYYDSTLGQYVDWDLPAGSRVKLKIKWRRTGPGDGNRPCERRNGTFESWFSVSQPYANGYEWWNGDNIEASLNGANFTQEIGGGGCAMINTYVNTLYVGANASAATELGNTPDNCENFIRWRRTGGIANMAEPLLFLLSGSLSCAGSKNWPKRRARIEVKWEIYRAVSTLVFETKPADALPDLFYEGAESYPIDVTTGFHLGNLTRFPSNQNQTALLPAEITLQFFNCFAFGNGVESYKIKDSMVGKSFSLGNRAYATAAQDYGEADRFADLTYSGVINDESNVNKLNEFNLGLLNFKPLEDSYGEIMRIVGRKTDILVLQEHKISYVLTEKDLLSDAGGGGALTSTPKVLGTQIARLEEYGISRNPESYVEYGYDKYFTDEKRGAVLQLKGTAYSNEELIVISEQGMRSWFRDTFVNPTYTMHQKLGGYDPYMNEYVLSINDRGLPLVSNCLDCGLQLSVDTDFTAMIAQCIELGETVGEVTITYAPVTADDFVVSVSWNGVTQTTGVTNVAGTLTINKTTPYPTEMFLTVTPSGSPSPVVDVTVSCPVPINITVVQICLTNAADAAQTIHNQTNFVDGGTGYISPLMPIDASAPVIFGGGSYPIVSQYDTYNGAQGFGGIPINGSTVYMYTRRINSDNFVFDPVFDDYYALRSTTLYNNNPTDIGSLLVAIQAAGASSGPFPVDSSGAPNQYSGNFTMPGPIAGSGSGEYLYLVYDYRNVTSRILCFSPYSTGSPAEIAAACCDCETCNLPECTSFGIDWVSGPAAKISYVNCAGATANITLNPNTGVNICAYQGTTYSITPLSAGTTEVSVTITQCNC